MKFSFIIYHNLVYISLKVGILASYVQYDQLDRCVVSEIIILLSV